MNESVGIIRAVGGKPVHASMPSAVGEPVSMPGHVATVGYTAPNDPQDVRNVQKLLNAVCASPAPVAENGDCGQSTIDAIIAFQRLFGLVADGKVDPDGNTIRRLNSVAAPLALAEPIFVDDGTMGGYLGYRLAYDRAGPPAPYRVLVAISAPDPGEVFPGRLLPDHELEYCMEVTGRSHNNVLYEGNLPDLMELIRKRKLWGLKAAARLYVTRDNVLISVSGAVPFPCPVQPYRGQLAPRALGNGDDGPRLKYIGTGNDPFIGRYLYHKKIGGARFWKYGSTLETNNDMRGFDCITYVGSLFEAAAKVTADNPFASSANMATALGASPALEGKPGTDVKDFFEKPANQGTFLMWKGTHIVVVHAATVFEFAASKGGFNEKPVKDWVGNDVSYMVYKLPPGKQF